MVSSVLTDSINQIATVCNVLGFSWQYAEALPDYLLRITKDYHANEVHMTSALVYLDKLHRKSPNLVPHLRGFLVLCLVLSLKFWEDKVHSNKHYAGAAGVTLQELNLWERNALQLLDYNLSISPTEYDLYWSNLTGLASNAAEQPTDVHVVTQSDKDASGTDAAVLTDKCSSHIKIAPSFAQKLSSEGTSCVKMITTCALSLLSLFYFLPNPEGPSDKIFGNVMHVWALEILDLP